MTTAENGTSGTTGEEPDVDVEVGIDSDAESDVDADHMLDAEDDIGAEIDPDFDVDQFAIPDVKAYAREIAHGDRVVVFDTTLRDGEQSPGATLNTQEKLDIARQLSRLGVDIMEAGFPAASPGDLDAVQQIANTVGREPRIGQDGKVAAPPIITGLARANKYDIDKAWEAVKAQVARASTPSSRPATSTWNTSFA